MGRKKISIQPINDERLRNITFNKRKAGLLKKAAELSMLCNIQIYLAFTDVYGNLINFFSPNMEIIEDFKKLHPYKRVYTFTKEDYPNFFGMRKIKRMKKEDGTNVEESVSVTNEDNGEDDEPSNSIAEEAEEKKTDKKQPKKAMKKNLKIIIPKNKDIEAEMEMLKMMNSVQENIPQNIQPHPQLAPFKDIKTRPPQPPPPNQAISPVQNTTISNTNRQPILNSKNESLFDYNGEIPLSILTANNSTDQAQKSAGPFGHDMGFGQKQEMMNNKFNQIDFMSQIRNNSRADPKPTSQSSLMGQNFFGQQKPTQLNSPNFNQMMLRMGPITSNPSQQIQMLGTENQQHQQQHSNYIQSLKSPNNIFTINDHQQQQQQQQNSNGGQSDMYKAEMYLQKAINQQELANQQSQLRMIMQNQFKAPTSNPQRKSGIYQLQPTSNPNLNQQLQNQLQQQQQGIQNNQRLSYAQMEQLKRSQMKKEKEAVDLNSSMNLPINLLSRNDSTEFTKDRGLQDLARLRANSQELNNYNLNKSNDFNITQNQYN